MAPVARLPGKRFPTAAVPAAVRLPGEICIKHLDATARNAIERGIPWRSLAMTWLRFGSQRFRKLLPRRANRWLWRPGLETLEDRVVPTVFTVRNVLDSGLDSL